MEIALTSDDEIVEIIRKTKDFTNKLFSGQIKDIGSLKSNAADVLKAHGLEVPEHNRQICNEHIKSTLEKYNISTSVDAKSVGDSGGCAACEIGLGIALAVIVIMLVVAVAAAIAAFAPEVAAAAATAFLENSAAIKIVIGIIVTAAPIVAAEVCTKLIKCK